MRHFTCDLCSRPVGKSEHFVATIEVRPTFNPDEITEADLDSDHLQEMAELIREIEETGVQPEDESEPRSFTFDLCQDCRTRLVRDPLGRELPRRLNFSQN